MHIGYVLKYQFHRQIKGGFIADGTEQNTFFQREEMDYGIVVQEKSKV